MVSYNGQSCVYDIMGNPTTYRGKTATWVNGRRLASFDGHTFTYDGQGRRLTKDSVVFAYDSNGRLIKQGDNMEFFYDQTGVVGLKHGTATYLYRKDAQGNVIALINENGAIVARYLYDAWGNVSVVDNNGALISDANHIGNLNPFRYRGYYYDTETKLYFLKTRYYDPEIGRFITIDGIEYLDPETINGLNLYAYCNNNPVSNVDPNGNKWWHWVVGIVLVAATTVAMVATAGLAATVIGVSSSVATAMMVGAGIATATAGIVNLGIQASQGVEEFNLGSLMVDMLFSGTVGMIAGGVGAAIGGYSIGAKTATQLLIHRGMQAGANVLISSTAYIVSKAIRGEQISLYGFTASVVTGFVTGAFFDTIGWKSIMITLGLELSSYGEDFLKRIKNSFNRLN